MSITSQVAVPGYEGLYSVTDDGRVWSERAQRFLVSTPNPNGYPQVNLRNKYGKGITKAVHRIMAWAFFGIKDSTALDHIDGNRANNLLLNLRLCTPSQNQANSGLKKSNTSGFKGVRYMPERKKWRSRITLNGKEIHLGYFTDQFSAVKAYDEMTTQLNGVFARTNLVA